VQDWHNWGKEALLDAVDHAVPAEPPKPTGEQLKAIGKVLDGDAPREYAAGDRIWTELGMSRVLAGSETGRCRWHLKDAPAVEPKPTSICLKCRYKYAGVGDEPHELCIDCFGENFEPLLPEPVKHYLCDGCYHEYSGFESQRCAACRDFDDINDAGQVYHQFWTPKQPEPAVICSICKQPIGDSVKVQDGDKVKHWHCAMNESKEPEPVVKENFTAVEPKGGAGLVGCKIIGGKGNELWIVDMPWGNSIALYKAVGRKDFAYIECATGSIVYALQAFDPNDPPVRAWFRA